MLFKKLKDSPTKDPKDELTVQPMGPSTALPEVAQASPRMSSKEVEKSPKPIGELWNEAYEELKEKEVSLVKDYEAAISKDMTILASMSLTLGAPEIAVRRKEQMAALVEKKVIEAKKNAWKLKYGDNEFLLEDMAEPVVNLIKDAEKFVHEVVSTNPCASIAWAGDITGQEGDFVKVYDIWKDHIAQDEYEKLVGRHNESMDALKLISDNIVGFQQAVASAQNDKRRADLISWLSTTDPSINYNNAREKHQPETCKWLVQDSMDFTNWKNAPNSFLWLNGNAGSGKTILSSSIIKHLKSSYGDDPQIAIACYYFRFDDQEKSSTMALARSLIKQLYCYRPNTPEAIEALHKYRDCGQTPELDDLRNAFIATVHGFSRVYIILDALDEFAVDASKRKNLLDFIRQVHRLDLTNVHMLCTSRREVDIERAFRPLFRTLPAETMDVNLSRQRERIDCDIGLHVDKTFESELYDDWSRALKVEVRQALVERADGMFQYVSCQFDALQGLPNSRAIRNALKDLSIGLDATYDRALQSIKPEYKKPVSNLLKWLAFSIIPLSVQELAEVFILDHNRKPPFDEEDRLNVPESVLSYLPSLITRAKGPPYVSSRTSKVEEVRLAHFSIKEYLTSSRVTKGPANFFSTTETEANMHISQACLAYHLHLSATSLAAEKQFKDLKHFQLWSYAARYWPMHMEQVPRASWRPSAINMARQALAPKSQSLLNMKRELDPVGYYFSLLYEDLSNVAAPLCKVAAPLYFISCLGATQLAEFLLEDGALVNELSPGDHGVSLIGAAAKGKTETVKLLLDHGADPNLVGNHKSNALQLASRQGHTAIVQLLLDRGADVNYRGGEFGTALIAASTSPVRKEVVQLLLNAGAEVNAKGGKHGNALYEAISLHDFECAELLITRGAEVWPPGPEWENHLQRIEDISGKEKVDRLRKFQEDPSSYISAEKQRKRQEEEVGREYR